MGIKTKFCPMGGGSSEKGSLSLWRYSNDVVEGRTLLYNYIGGQTLLRNGYIPISSSGTPLYLNYGVTPNVGEYMLRENGAKTSYIINRIINSNYFYTTATSVPFDRNTSVDVYSVANYPDTLYVPRVGGKALINDWASSATSGTTELNRNTPFFNNPYVNNVDLQGVSFNNNRMYNTFSNCLNLVSVNRISSDITSMYYAFANCRKLISVDSLPDSVTNMASTFYNCFNLNQNIQIPDSVTSMTSTFFYCANLNQNIQIPTSVTNMASTFYYCANLNQNIQIPNSVTNMASTFYYCNRLNQNIQIPNSVTNMASTFYNCFNLNQNIQIPNSVTSMAITFYHCNRLNQNIQIPNSVTSMTSTFMNCSNLNQEIKIPASVNNLVSTFDGCSNLNRNIQILSTISVNMCYTFRNCYNLNQAILIPESVLNLSETFENCYNLNKSVSIPKYAPHLTRMVGTFNNCYNLNSNINVPTNVTYLSSAFLNCYNFNSWINIYSSELVFASTAFNTSNSNNTTSPKIPIVVLPARYINNAATSTQLAIKNAGWVVSGLGELSGTAPNQIRSWDLIKGDYNLFMGNGTHWILNKWNGALSTYINGGSTVYDVVVNQNYNTYGIPYPTAVSNNCFQNNTSVASINFNNAITASASIVNGFRDMSNMKSLVHCIIPDGVTNVYGTFCNMQNISKIQVTPIATSSSIPDHTAYIQLPNSVTNIRTLLSDCHNIYNHYVYALSITGASNSSHYIFAGQKDKTGYYVDVPVPGGIGNAHYYYLLAPNMTNVTNLFYDYTSDVWKKLYIYYTYANGVNTKTFNTIKNLAVYKGTSGNGAGVMPLYNSTSKFAVYDYGKCPV